MTVHSLDHIWSLPGNILARLEHRARPDANASALIEETVALRRCALYRNAFRGTAAVSYPAALLGFDAVSAWIRRHRLTVDVATAGELDQAISAGIDPVRIVMHLRDGAVAPIHRAANAGVRRFVVDSSRQIASLAGSIDRIQLVVVDATDESVNTLASEVLAHNRLDLIGLHCILDDPDDPIGAVKLRGVIADMSRIRRERGVVLSRVSLTDLDLGAFCQQPRVLRCVAEAVGEVIEDACAQYRHPRPALALSPRPAMLLPQ